MTDQNHNQDLNIDILGFVVCKCFNYVVLIRCFLNQFQKLRFCFLVPVSIIGSYKTYRYYFHYSLLKTSILKKPNNILYSNGSL